MDAQHLWRQEFLQAAHCSATIELIAQYKYQYWRLNIEWLTDQRMLCLDDEKGFQHLIIVMYLTSKLEVPS